MSLISVNNLSFRYDGSFTDVFENVSFNIELEEMGKVKPLFLSYLWDNINIVAQFLKM